MALSAKTLAQLGWVFHNDAEAMRGDAYAIPRHIPSEEDRTEARRLDDVAGELFERAESMGFGSDGRGNGTDAAFGRDSVMAHVPPCDRAHDHDITAPVAPVGFGTRIDDDGRWRVQALTE